MPQKDALLILNEEIHSARDLKSNQGRMASSHRKAASWGTSKASASASIAVRHGAMRRRTSSTLTRSTLCRELTLCRPVWGRMVYGFGRSWMAERRAQSSTAVRPRRHNRTRPVIGRGLSDGA